MEARKIKIKGGIENSSATANHKIAIVLTPSLDNRFECIERSVKAVNDEVDSLREGLWVVAFIAIFMVLAFTVFLKEARAERPPLDIPNRTYSHPASVVIVEERDGWKLCGLNKQCLAEIAADVGGDTRTLVFFKAPTTFYIEGCYGNEVCYGGGPMTKIPWVKCGASGLDPENEFAACQIEAATGRLMWDEFDFSINYQCQYMRRKAHNRIGRVANPSECYQRLATQSRRECIKDYFSPRYVCGYHKGETKNQWSAWVVEK